jgi:hypothetical protein
VHDLKRSCLHRHLFISKSIADSDYPKFTRITDCAVTQTVSAMRSRSWYNSVGTATGYGLDGRGLNTGRDNVFLFSAASRPALGPTQPPIQWVPRALSPGVK